jgi:hypothetical protein
MSDFPKEVVELYDEVLRCIETHTRADPVFIAINMQEKKIIFPAPANADFVSTLPFFDKLALALKWMRIRKLVGFIHGIRVDPANMTAQPNLVYVHVIDSAVRIFTSILEYKDDGSVTLSRLEETDIPDERRKSFVGPLALFSTILPKTYNDAMTPEEAKYCEEVCGPRPRPPLMN